MNSRDSDNTSTTTAFLTHKFCTAEQCIVPYETIESDIDGGITWIHWVVQKYAKKKFQDTILFDNGTDKYVYNVFILTTIRFSVY